MLGVVRGLPQGAGTPSSGGSQQTAPSTVLLPQRLGQVPLFEALGISPLARKPTETQTQA